MLRERAGDAGGIGIGAAPFAGFAPHRVDGADPLGQRIHHIQIADDLLLVRNGDAESGQRQLFRQRKEIAQMRGRHQERQIDRIDAPRLKGAIVNGGRNGMAHGVGDDAVDLGGLGEFFHAIDVAQRARAHLSGGGALRLHGRRVSVDAAENGREHARGKTQLAHGQHHQAVPGHGLDGGQHARVVGRLARGGDYFVCVGGNARHAIHHRFHGRRSFEVVIRHNHVGASAELLQTLGGRFGGFDFDIDGLRAVLDGADRAAQAALRCCR